MNPHAKSVSPLEGYQLEVSFVNGETRLFDVKPYLDRGVFTRLRDPALFRSARVVAGSVEWPGGLDLSYDTLFLEGQQVAAPLSPVERTNAAPPQARG